MHKFGIGIVGLFIGVTILGCVGWVKCIVKLTHTDFNAPYKAEVLYGVGILTGAGAIIGWIDIED